jgi:hypothetical protein
MNSAPQTCPIGCRYQTANLLVGKERWLSALPVVHELVNLSRKVMPKTASE